MTGSAVLDVHLTGLELAGIPVLGDIALTSGWSETIAIMGPSGVGKTSLLRCIAGLETRFSGHVHVQGRVAMVFQEPTLLPWRTVSENLSLPTGVSPDQAMALLADVGLADKGDVFPNSLSLGQQRRLSLARAFAVAPDLLLMDEPFVSLDPDLVDEMMNLFATLRAKHDVTTVFVTHLEAEAKRLASRIVTVSGSPARIASDRANPVA